MTRDDKYGLAGVLLCGTLAWIDPWWRPFWILCATLLGVWTAMSLWKRRRQ